MFMYDKTIYSRPRTAYLVHSYYQKYFKFFTQSSHLYISGILEILTEESLKLLPKGVFF